MLAVRQVLVVVKCLKILVIMAQTQNEVITELSKNGAKSEQVVVKNLKVKTFEKYTRCRVTVDHEVDGYVSEDNGVTYKLGKTNVVFISLFNLVNALRDTEYDVVIDHICDHPQSMVVLLKDAKVTLVQQNVKAGDTPDGVDAPLEHDAIYWHCKSIEFSDAAKLRLDKIVDKMLGL